MAAGNPRQRHPALLAALCLFAALPAAAAGWQRVAGNENVALYIDPASLERKGERARLKNLIDFKAPQTDRSIGGKPYRSRQEVREYDCRDPRYRLTWFSLRDGPMFAGALVRSQADDGAWSPVAPGSLGEALWRRACGGK
mgnify:FL=1